MPAADAAGEAGTGGAKPVVSAGRAGWAAGAAALAAPLAASAEAVSWAKASGSDFRAAVSAFAAVMPGVTRGVA